MSDPFKAIVREYDARVVSSGGVSLFEYKPPRPPMIPVRDGKPSVWSGDKLSNLRAAYGSSLPVREVAKAHSISLSFLYALARRNGWTPRSSRSRE